MILRSEIISLCGRAVCWIRSGAGVYRCNWNRGINTIRVYPVTPGFVLEKIVIYPPWKQTGRSLSWTDRNVSVQELIIYQYSEEHVSPFAERKYGMG